jgi:16S rRNA (cytosine1402-N4)-methyltransferase
MTTMTGPIRAPASAAITRVGDVIDSDTAMPHPPHLPVLLAPILTAVAPVKGLWVDGTLGAGGYARALLDAGATRVVGIDRDPLALVMARDWAAPYGERIALVQGTFSALDRLAGAPADGVVLDLGVSSMQLDRAERGFSFQKDGPLDMRMAQDGTSAADLVATLSEVQLADILYVFGEETASRRIARAIVEARARAPITTTLALAEIVARCLPRPKPGQSHPATRSFQALRIAVNAEMDELAGGLAAAERALRPGGKLAVVTFHSLEDRVVKHYLASASGQATTGNRHAPPAADVRPRFRLLARRAVLPDAAEIARNPRARSAKLRLAERLDAPPLALEAGRIGLPVLPQRHGGAQTKGRRA